MMISDGNGIQADSMAISRTIAAVTKRRDRGHDKRRKDFDYSGDHS